MTAVGATADHYDQKGASFSTGGFSAIFDQPSYQQSAVASYLENITNNTYEASGYFDASKRAVPDLAVTGVNFSMVEHGKRYLASGTSGSAAAFAGAVASLNEYRLTAGLSVLGLLNPRLYAIQANASDGGVFTDVTEGSSVGCVGNEAFQVGVASWNATVGWDPVSGLGYPDVATLLDVVLEG